MLLSVCLCPGEELSAHTRVICHNLCQHSKRQRGEKGAWCLPVVELPESPGCPSPAPRCPSPAPYRPRCEQPLHSPLWHCHAAPGPLLSEGWVPGHTTRAAEKEGAQPHSFGVTAAVPQPEPESPGTGACCPRPMLQQPLQCFSSPHPQRRCHLPLLLIPRGARSSRCHLLLLPGEPQCCCAPVWPGTLCNS